MLNRIKTRQVNIGKVCIGGENSIAIQSMTNLSVEKIDETVCQIRSLIDAGCDIVRIAVPNMTSAKMFAKVRDKVDIPLVADIHFDYRLAIASIEAGADKIRINPGNIAEKNLDNVIDAAKAYNVAIRIGVNGGSVNKGFIYKYRDPAQALVESVKHYVNYFETRGFYDLVLSAKSSDIVRTLKINRALSALHYPMHLGITEAGPTEQGILKNAIGIGSLLADGIGDTVRVSLTADPVEEVIAAKQILNVLGIGRSVQFVSCPKCGRCTVDLEGIASAVYDYVKNLDCNLKIAVMGCEVNGPGECRDADLGLAGANGQFVFFKKGQIYKYVNADSAVREFIDEINLLCKG